MSAHSPGLFLGLDGGGTKTASVILDENRHELGRGLGGPCNIATTSDEQLRVSVSQAFSSARVAAGLLPDIRFEAVCAGVAGYTAKRRRAQFARLLQDLVPAKRYRVEPDFKIAYWGATEGEPGIIVSAGTGAVVYGRNAEGAECRFDGRGFLLGDSGSAFDIAIRCLRWLTLRLDKQRPLHDFDRAIMAYVEAEDADDIIEWVYRDFQPGRIASLATEIARHAAAGDRHAKILLLGQGWSLRGSAEWVKQTLQLSKDAPVYLLGSAWSAGDEVIKAFVDGNPTAPVKPAAPNIREPLHDAGYGAALLAMLSSRASNLTRGPVQP